MANRYSIPSYWSTINHKKMMNYVANKLDKTLGKHAVAEGQGPPVRSTDVMMKAVTWEGAKKARVSILGKPLLTDSKDVILKVTACCICSGSDSHVFCKEIPGLEPGFTLGHECCGVVEQVGADVKKHKVGDRVVVAFNIACGECARCRAEEYSGCDLTNQSKLGDKFFGHAHGAIFGYGNMLGNVPGSQAEFVRVPIADVNCYPIPDDVPDEKALYLSDVLCTSLHATEMGEVGEGDTVVIWGLGPIGLYSARWCQIKGARRVIGVDLVPERLALARDRFHIEVVDRKDLSSHELVERLQSMVPEGADTVIEAVGFRFPTTALHKFERAVGLETDTADILTECMTVVRKYGRVSIIGDYCGITNHFPIGQIMMKHLTVRSGQCPCQKYFKYVMEKVQSGEVDPTLMITHRITLDEAPEAYENLFQQTGGYIKTFIVPGASPLETKPQT